MVLNGSLDWLSGVSRVSIGAATNQRHYRARKEGPALK